MHSSRHPPALSLYHGIGRQVGCVSKSFASELALFLGDAVELRPSIPRAGPFGQDGPGYVLAPYATSVEERTRLMAGLVQGLVDVGAIPRQAVRNELQVCIAVRG